MSMAAARASAAGGPSWCPSPPLCIPGGLGGLHAWSWELLIHQQCQPPAWQGQRGPGASLGGGQQPPRSPPGALGAWVGYGANGHSVWEGWCLLQPTNPMVPSLVSPQKLCPLPDHCQTPTRPLLDPC